MRIQSESQCFQGLQTMKSSGKLIGLIIAVLFTVMSSGEELALDDPQLTQQETEKDLIEAMTALLGRYQNQNYPPSTEKRGIPQCAVGSRCALKFGPRIGKLCECGRGSNCNSFLLKCI
nr:cocaine- and amphetamine-regulated transcript-like isoform X1 [Misgurnus anguillicaudatus]